MLWLWNELVRNASGEDVPPFASTKWLLTSQKLSSIKKRIRCLKVGVK